MCYGEKFTGRERSSPQQETDTGVGKMQEFRRGCHANPAETGCVDLEGR